MSCDISFLKNHIFRNFISKILVYDGQGEIVISQNHISKSFLKIFAKNLCSKFDNNNKSARAGSPCVWQSWYLIAVVCLHGRGHLSASQQPAPIRASLPPIRNENDKNISTKIINILIILKCNFQFFSVMKEIGSAFCYIVMGNI